MTTREWFRTLRANYQPTEVERHILGCVREGHWLEAEFWTLLYSSTLGTFTEEHYWRLDNDYMWRCTACGATVASDEIGETAPPRNQFSADCQCPACLPCIGVTRCSES